MLQKLRSRKLFTASQINFFGNILHHFQYFHLLIKCQSILTVITELNSFTNVKTAAVGFYLPQKHFQKSGFSRSVFPDNAHFFVAGKGVIEIIQNGEVFVAFADVFRFKNFRSEVTRFYTEFHVVRYQVLFGPFFNVLKTVGAAA